MAATANPRPGRPPKGFVHGSFAVGDPPGSRRTPRWSNGLDVPRLKNIQKDLVAHPALSQPLGKWPLIQHVPTCCGMFRPLFLNRKTSRPARFRMVPTLKSLSLQQYAHNSAISFLAGVNQLAWRVYGEKSSETANPEIIWNHSLNLQIKTMIEAFL